MGLLASAKNAAAQAALRHLLEKHAGPYAELREVKVDTKARTISAVLRPKGPDERDLDLTLGYALVMHGKTEMKALEVTQAESTRPWVQDLARDHLVGRTFELPKAAAALLG